MNSTMKLTRKVALTLVTATALAACGKSVGIGNISEVNRIGAAPPSAAQCDPAHLRSWLFSQPVGVETRVQDLLFVVDTSLSMAPKRERIADAIPAFLSHLPPGTDLRVGVMLGHGGASNYSGRLYQADKEPKVLSSKTLSISALQEGLRKKLSSVKADRDEANGEALLYSLMKSFDTKQLRDIKGQDFYRSNAGLSVAFISDENDICVPDDGPSSGGIEKIAYDKYCPALGNDPMEIPQNIYSQLKSFKNGLPLALAGIVHVDPAQVPKGPSFEDSLGHGYLELLGLTPGGVAIDINQADYSQGLSTLAGTASTQLTLLTDFQLDGAESLQASSVSVTVDGKRVPATFDLDTRKVQIEEAQAGHAQSAIVVSACLADG